MKLPWKKSKPQEIDTDQVLDDILDGMDISECVESFFRDHADFMDYVVIAFVAKDGNVEYLTNGINSLVAIGILQVAIDKINREYY